MSELEQKKVTVAWWENVIAILGIAVIVLTILLVCVSVRLKDLRYYEARDRNHSFNSIPFCMRVAEAHVNGDTGQILAMATDYVKETGIPDLEAYAELDLAFSGLAVYGGIEALGPQRSPVYRCTIRYRLLSPVPEALKEEIPPECIEHRDGKDYIYQEIELNTSAEHFEDAPFRSTTETYGWKYLPMGFNGEPFDDGYGAETVMWNFLARAE